ncbi:MAG: hypothetical protein Q8P56_01470 [Candidatus Uhrbacteria bacterium]|nr:hypothetical protein [Candidatus Uhrbacteria bacterium]
MKSIEKALKQLDFSENAIKIYLQSFHTGRSTIGALAKYISMDRSSAYLAVQQLIAEGLLKEDVIDGKKHVWASPPNIIEDLLKNHAKQLSDIAHDIDTNLGELLINYKTNNSKVALQSFSGNSSLPRITQDILSSDISEVRIITNQNAERKVFSASAHDDFIQSRVRKGIKAYVLAADTKGADLLQRYDERELRETRINKSLTPLKNETYIYGDNVAVLGFSDTIFGFIVHDKEFAELQRLLFDQLFQADK